MWVTPPAATNQSEQPTPPHCPVGVEYIPLTFHTSTTIYRLEKQRQTGGGTSEPKRPQRSLKYEV